MEIEVRKLLSLENRGKAGREKKKKSIQGNLILYHDQGLILQVFFPQENSSSYRL